MTGFGEHQPALEVRQTRHIVGRGLRIERRAGRLGDRGDRTRRGGAGGGRLAGFR